MKSSVMAGDDAYQFVFTHSIAGLVDYLTTRALYNLDALPYLDFDAPWWDTSLIETYRLGGKAFYCAGDITIRPVNGVLFNKTIASEFDLPDHYQLVRDGKWTFDLMFEYASMVPADTNGDGKIGVEDRTGFSSDIQDTVVNIPFATGDAMTKVTDDGIELVFWNEKQLDLFNKCYDFFMTSGNSQAYIRSVGDGQDFDEGLSLYRFGGSNQMINLRDSGVEFGLVPYPKYDEAQKNYSTYGWPTFVCVPTTISDPECVGASLEYFAYKSGDLLHEYNETLVRGKSARDVESLEMIDLINETLVYDVCGSYLGFDDGFHKIFYSYLELFRAKNNNIASHYEKSQKSVNKSLEKLYRQIMDAAAED